ncbi:MAG: hypothetical protein WAZ18_04500 [Alphaproteobacteria bacterium]
MVKLKAYQRGKAAMGFITFAEEGLANGPHVRQVMAMGGGIVNPSPFIK